MYSSNSFLTFPNYGPHFIVTFGEEFANPGQGQEEKQCLVGEAGAEKALAKHLSQNWGV